MPICRRCNTPFANRALIDGKIRVLNSRKFCLDCSPFGRHNTRDLPQNRSSTTRTCPACRQKLPLSAFYARRDGKNTTPYCKACTNAQALERQQKLKLQAVAYKGGLCELCGYSRYVGALEFHHRDPGAKDFRIAHVRFTTFEKLKPELDKCSLVCANCHRELHAKSRGLL